MATTSEEVWRILGELAEAQKETVARYAYRQGLFVMAQSGDSVVILNDATFQPRNG